MRAHGPRRRGHGVPLAFLGLALSASAGTGQAVEPAAPAIRSAGGEARATLAPPSRHDPGDILLDVPYIAQTEALCGGAAVTMALRYWGDTRTRPERFEPLLTPDGTGIRTDDLRAATAELGWTALGLRGDARLLDAQLARGRPLIALLEVGPGRYHYVTVVGRVDDRIVFHDPAASPYRTLGEDAFLDAWSGGAFWAMLVLPDPTTAEDTRTASGRAAAGGGSADGRAPARTPAAPPPPACEAPIERAVRLARGGRFHEAEEALRSATRSCPDHPRAFRELAALRLRQDRPTGAIAAARTAVARDPADRHARELLAAGHYLAGDEVAAVAEWNRLDPVVVDEITLGAPTRTRNRPILAFAGIEPGRHLSAEALAVGRRRLEQIPAAASTRLSVRPLDDGRVLATAAVAERPVVPSPARLAAEAALGLFTERGVRLRSASPFGHGELLSVEWRWREARRHVGVSLALPVRAPIPAVLTVGGAATRETTRFDEELREDRRRLEVGLSAWTTSWLRVSLTGAFDRWLARGSFGSIGASTRLSGLGDRLRLSVGGSVWASPGAAPGFARAGAELSWTSSRERRGVVAAARLGGRAATAGAPRSVWPGAGAEGDRDALARGHVLRTDGRITGPLFGRRILYAGLETVRWTGLGPLDAGLAAFVDVAAAGARPAGIAGGALQTDVGLGVRLGLPGGAALRVDVGRGLLDGDTAVSAGLALDGS